MANTADRNKLVTRSCSDEGLTLETSAFQSLYGDQFTLTTPLINQIFVFYSPTHAAPLFLQKLTPFTQNKCSLTWIFAFILKLMAQIASIFRVKYFCRRNSWPKAFLNRPQKQLGQVCFVAVLRAVHLPLCILYNIAYLM